MNKLVFLTWISSLFVTMSLLPYYFVFVVFFFVDVDIGA